MNSSNLSIPAEFLRSPDEFVSCFHHFGDVFNHGGLRIRVLPPHRRRALPECNPKSKIRNPKWMVSGHRSDSPRLCPHHCCGEPRYAALFCSLPGDVSAGSAAGADGAGAAAVGGAGVPDGGCAAGVIPGFLRPARLRVVRPCTVACICPAPVETAWR